MMSNDLSRHRLSARLAARAVTMAVDASQPASAAVAALVRLARDDHDALERAARQVEMRHAGSSSDTARDALAMLRAAADVAAVGPGVPA